jgi:hypothetical protein
MTIWGITVLKVERGYARLFTGIGSLGFTKRFDWYDVTEIAEERWSSSDSGTQRTRLIIKADKDIRFGTMLSEERRRYMLNALRKLLDIRGGEK